MPPPISSGLLDDLPFNYLRLVHPTRRFKVARMNLRFTYLLSSPLMIAIASTPRVAHAETDVTKVTPQVQSVRDSERIRILKDELAKTTNRLAELARQRADRIAADDAKGAEELDLQRARVLADREGLQREINATPRLSSTVSAIGKNVSTTSTGSRQQASTTLPWWDVYDDRLRPSFASRQPSTEP